MGIEGLIFGVIAVAWLAYLVPAMVRRRDDPGADEVESTNRFAESMRIIRHATAPIQADAGSGFEISTPLTRRAAMREVRRANSTAAFRRSLGSLVLLTATLAAVVLSIFTTIPLVMAVIPAGMLVAWLGLCRYSTRALNRALDGRVAEIQADWRDDTISFEVPAELLEVGDGEAEWSVEFAAPSPGQTGSLWDPIPVTTPVYTNSPLAARTVRTIDLAAPSSPRMDLPPVAQKPEGQASGTHDPGMRQLPFASGE